MRAQIRSGISGLTGGSRPATALPVLGDDTRRILGVKEDSDEDSAIEDPNTESLKSRPVSVPPVPPVGSEILQPQVFSVSRGGPGLSPPTNMRSGAVPGISQLRASKSPVRALFPDPPTSARTGTSRSSTLVDAESLHESSQPDQSKSRQSDPSRPVLTLHQ